MKKLNLILVLLLTVLLITGCKNSEKITEEQAKAIALEHAGVTAQQAENFVIYEDYDDGRRYYDVHFHFDGYEYDYEINAKNGKVLDYDKEYEPHANAPENDAVNTGADTATPNADTATAAITEEDAKRIALEHAKLTAETVTGLRAGLDRDDGRDYYDVSFYHDGYEYDYEIDAKSGNILDFDKDFDD